MGKLVAVSGGFDPIHFGHVKLIEEAKKLGDNLVVILNNDNWLIKKKGYAFMPQTQRVHIVNSNKDVDGVIVTTHPENPDDMSVCDVLEQLKPDIFANGGDRHKENIPEYELCEKLGIEMVFNVGGVKIESSTELIKKVQSSTELVKD